MIAKMPLDTKFEITYNQYAFNSLSEQEQIKWGLSYAQRQIIWNKIIFAERDSQSEADKRYPLTTGLTQEDMFKNVRLAEKLKIEKEKKVINEHRITRSILDSIGVEGLANDWAFPKRN